MRTTRCFLRQQPRNGTLVHTVRSAREDINKLCSGCSYCSHGGDCSWIMWLYVMLWIISSVWATGNLPTGERLKAVSWLHIPKTSSWIGDFLFLYACPHMRPEYEANGNEEFLFEIMKSNQTSVDRCKTKVLGGRDGAFGWHSPYVAEYSHGSTVALFRKPKARLISAFLFEGGMMIPPGHLYSTNETHHPIIFEYIRNTTHPIMTYANYLGIPSCQTKMVLGHNCGTEFPITESALDEAKRRVEHEFAFIGLTEESGASAKLFYAMYGGKDAMETPFKPYAKLYRSNDRYSKEERLRLAEVLREQRWSDPPEVALYQHVRKVFYRRCARYNIPTLEHYEGV